MFLLFKYLCSNKNGVNEKGVIILRNNFSYEEPKKE